MKRILLTGSNGLLGQKLVYKLRDRPDVALTATARGANRLLAQDGYRFLSLNIEDRAEVDSVFDTVRPHCVIHTAAMTNVDACELDPAACHRANVDAVGHLALAANRHGSHFVHVSTDFIFNGLDGPYDEEAQPDPVSHYGRSKLRAEEIVRGSGLRWAILRTVLVYGIVDNMSRSNIVLWAKGALEKGQRIRVVDDQQRCPTLAEDLADGCILAADKEAEGIYNISGPEALTIMEIVEAVADHYGLDKSLIDPVSSSTLSQPAKRPPRTPFIIDKARRELGYSPHTFREGIALMQQQVAAMGG